MRVVYVVKLRALFFPRQCPMVNSHVASPACFSGNPGKGRPGSPIVNGAGLNLLINMVLYSV